MEGIDLPDCGSMLKRPIQSRGQCRREDCDIRLSCNRFEAEWHRENDMSSRSTLRNRTTIQSKLAMTTSTWQYNTSWHRPQYPSSSLSGISRIVLCIVAVESLVSDQEYPLISGRWRCHSHRVESWSCRHSKWSMESENGITRCSGNTKWPSYTASALMTGPSVRERDKPSIGSRRHCD